MRRRRVKPLLARPKSSHQSPLRRQSAPAKLPIQSTPAPRPHLRVRAPQRHPHIEVHEPDPIDTPVFSTPRPARKRRVSETPIRPHRVSESPLPSAEHPPAAEPTVQGTVDVIASPSLTKRARVRYSPSFNALRSGRAGDAGASGSPVHNSALLASPGLLSAHIPLTVESVFSSGENASHAPTTYATQRRISFGATAERQSPDKGAQPGSHSQSQTKRASYESARSSGPSHGRFRESHPVLSPELTQRHPSPEAPQQQPPSEQSHQQPSPEPSQQPLIPGSPSKQSHQQPSPEPSQQPLNPGSPFFPRSLHSPTTPNHAHSKLSTPASQFPTSPQTLQASLPPKAPTKSPPTARIQDTKRFRNFTISPSAGNSICSWGGEIESPSLTALNVFRKPKEQSNEAPLQLRVRSPARCTPSAPSPSVSDPSSAQEAERTPVQLRRDPVTTADFEQLIPETPILSGKRGGREVEHDGKVELQAKETTEGRVDTTDHVQGGGGMGTWRSKNGNEVVDDDCSSTQSPCSADLIDNSTQEAREENTKGQNAAVYCRSVLVSVPSGALRSFDNSESPQ
ncbi:extensin isoform X1 [Gracilaria domingensis]|nr:extensin isoform X1 [Gracilaria domingensis]